MTSTTYELSVEEDQKLQFRRAMSNFASGVTVVTGRSGSEPVGFTCQSFASLSLEPLLVSISVMNTSTTYPMLREDGRFAANILSQPMQHLSNQFARKGTDKWKDVSWSTSRAGSPILDSCLAWVDCRIEAEFVTGDHVTVIGAVEEFGVSGSPAEPLLFFNGEYRRLAETELRS